MRKIQMSPKKRTSTLIQAIRNDSLLGGMSWSDPSNLICDVVLAMAKKCNQQAPDLTDLADFLDQLRES